MTGLCLEILLSGIISITDQNMSIDTNNGVIYNTKGKTSYVLPDQENQLILCLNQEKLSENKTLNRFDMIQTIE